jgi:mannose-6-phosphate isomerase
MLYPLRFQPLFRDYLWGGRRLATVLGKKLPGEGIYAESWEIVDRGHDQSIVLAGPLAGGSLAEIVHHHGRELFGQPNPPRQFPWLFKFLDAQQMLSIQVHPTDQQATSPERGKTEAWVVISAEPHSFLYAGLQPEVNAATFRTAIEDGMVEQCLHRIEPSVGDCIFLPAGTVHALGAGLLVAEIQQSSDMTYRIFDWNRQGPDGKTRPLHVAEALHVINFAAGPARLIRRGVRDELGNETLVACDYFVLQRCQLTQPVRLPDENRLRLLAVVADSVQVTGDPMKQPLGLGETILIPAACRDITLVPHPAATLLQILLP